MSENQQFRFCLVPTSVPIQIWPDPILTIKSGHKINSIRKFYKFIIIFAIISAIFSNSYYVVTKFFSYSSPPTMSVSVPANFLNNIFQPLVNSNISNDLPIRLKIPNINIDVSIQQVGLTPEGVLDVPVSVADVGWYKFGPRPGQKGSAVIDGHVDGPDGSPAIFNQLHTLRKGDSIVVENDKNKSIYFIVKKVINYPVDSYVSDVFSSNDGIHLNLITCYGFWDTNKNTYSERLIVFADAVQQ